MANFYAPRPRTSALYSSRCPRCGAGYGQACRNKEGEQLPGVHFERNTERRKAIAAAFDLYRPIVRKENSHV